MKVCKNTKFRPNIHYLDIIAKIQSQNGRVVDIIVSETQDKFFVEFKHSYPSNEVIFTEKLIYNSTREILRWVIETNIKVVTIYDELSN
ncbi:hypothetical protein QQ991_10850 [Weizmannia coagulans]|uniref:Uncharacterized protein n=2 Tax=Heyndrickxia TaxID=2837504 RepID=A0AAN0T6P5_HEYCO|nr:MULTISPECIES: hypothetical protein [Heyndrickxia]AJO22849.1 hypothetical protein SB48_HM08orf03266 [Heyndrickxia coagulans]ATW83093.1 hypothetical protein CIW84_08930 [Heyndrickxia coagulans]KGB28450.1 hypothetical protein IE89_17055 [Heyndrickxia coagulans]KXT22077.1 hypothetical protein UZ35_00485 [Heyndrickxia coagulans]MBQ4910545.1 hypothetical protein [Heyndrickxia faecalis]